MVQYHEYKKSDSTEYEEAEDQEWFTVLWGAFEVSLVLMDASVVFLIQMMFGTSPLTAFEESIMWRSPGSLVQF